MTLALAVVLGLAAVLWTVAPLLRAAEEPMPEPEERGRRGQLDQRRSALYESIRDIDFEFAMGKLAPDDYRTARAELLRDAAEVLREIDSVSGDDALERWIEAEVAARSGAGGARSCPGCGRANPASARFCDGCGASIEGRSCRSCGAPVRGGARFCGACGGRL